MERKLSRTSLTYFFVAVALAVSITSAAPAGSTTSKLPILKLETLNGTQAEKMMADGKLTSVELTQAYIARIDALNKSGPGLNAVTQLNPDALKEAALADKERAEGKNLGPAMGLPILLKDIIDATPMYTSAGNYSLRNSFPPTDSGVAKALRSHGVVILGKAGLTEWANSFGSQPSGFGNLTGQVINAIDADQNPSGSSSGSASAASSALSMLTIGTETSGSIISPSQTQADVGLRPTVGLVPGYGIAPIDASQDTAGPIARTVSEVAMTLQSIAVADPLSAVEYGAVFGPDYLKNGDIPPPPAKTPNYMSALNLGFVKGKRIGYNGTLTPGSPLQLAYNALVAAGAIMVSDPQTTVGAMPALPSGYEAHKTIDAYFARLGPKAPVQNLVQEVAINLAEAGQALKFGNSSHLSESLSDISAGGANETGYRTNLPIRKAAFHLAIDTMMNMGTPNDPSDDVIGVLGSVPSGPQAGYPQITIPMGYNAATRRALSLSVNGGAYDERNLIGIAYVIEQATHLRKPASYVDPSMYRCAHTATPEPYSGRGFCNPDYQAVMKLLGSIPHPVLPFSLETTSAQALESMLNAGTLSSQQLVEAYLYRIGIANANGPSIQAVRALNTDAIAEAKASDAQRKKSGSLGPLMGIPVLLDDSIDAKGMPTSGGSIALEDNMPSADSTIVAKLKAAGAIILGKTNVTELDGLFDANIPEGYSSLGGQVLLPSDTDKTPAGSSGGSAAATASGLAALTIGMETSTDSAQLIAPAAAAGVVALKPTVGLVSRTGVLPVARSQDSPGPIGRTVFDVATALDAIAGADSSDGATAGTPSHGSYTAGLSPGALNGKRIAVIASATDPYPAMVSTLQSLGATVVVKTVAAPANVPSIVSTEFKRDVDAYLGSGHSGGAKSLQDLITYNFAHPAEGLKYQQGELLAAEGVNLGDPATASLYLANLGSGKAASQNAIDTVLNNGTPNDSSDDFEAIMVPTADPSVGYADRAGYPILTIPAGYGATNSGAGHNPIGIALIGTAYSESRLLADGYALEQATKVRLAPSVTNPSMWRCVAGSTFFTAELCQPGDLQLTQLGANITDLSTLIGDMGLNSGLTTYLTSHLGTAGTKITSTTEQCSGLGLGDVLSKIIYAAGAAKPMISMSDAQSIVSNVNSIYTSIGCAHGQTLTPKAGSEGNVVALFGTIDHMGLPNSLAGPLRKTVGGIGVELTRNNVPHACVLVSSLGKQISGAKGLTPTDAGQLTAARMTIGTALGCG